MNIQDLAAPPELARVVTCQYCNQPAKLVTGKVVYPHRSDLWSNKLWYCETDLAWVGCHPGNPTNEPLGILADAELRRLKMRVHALFDPLWGRFKGSTLPSKPPFKGNRSAAYHWLSGALGIPGEQCHVGMFTNERCKEALRVLRVKWDLLGWQLPLSER